MTKSPALSLFLISCDVCMYEIGEFTDIMFTNGRNLDEWLKWAQNKREGWAVKAFVKVSR